MLWNCASSRNKDILVTARCKGKDTSALSMVLWTRHKQITHPGSIDSEEAHFLRWVQVLMCQVTDRYLPQCIFFDKGRELWQFPETALFIDIMHLLTESVTNTDGPFPTSVSSAEPMPLTDHCIWHPQWIIRTPGMSTPTACTKILSFCGTLPWCIIWYPPEFWHGPYQIFGPFSNPAADKLPRLGQPESTCKF